MSKGEKLLFRILAAAGILLTIMVGIAGRQAINLATAWQTPLGPALELPTWTLSPLGAITPTHLAATAFPQVTLRPTITLPGQPSPIPSVTALEYLPLGGDAQCGAPPVMTVLAIGSDTRSETYLYGLADVIRAVRIDFITPRVTVLEFPRDFWVKIPGIDAHYGITQGKLNQAYFYGNPGMGYYSGPGQGPGLLARTLDANFGLHVDHYLAINMRTFEKVIDAVGGLDVDLPYTVDARKPDQPNRDDLVFDEGPHHLDGPSALMLARIRQYTVFGRASNQNLVLCALRDKLVSPGVFPQIPAIVEAFKGSVQTDLSPQDITQLACLASQGSHLPVAFAEFPQSLMTSKRIYDSDMHQDVFIFDVDNGAIRSYVKNFVNGIWPALTAVLGTPSASGTGGAICP